MKEKYDKPVVFKPKNQPQQKKLLVVHEQNSEFSGKNQNLSKQIDVKELKVKVKKGKRKIVQSIEEDQD